MALIRVRGIAMTSSPDQSSLTRAVAGGFLAELVRAASSPQPADQALAGSHRVLLRGEAGSGKSTLVQWLAVTAARQELTPQMEYLYDRIPFVLPLRTLTRHGEQLPDPQSFLAAVGCPIRESSRTAGRTGSFPPGAAWSWSTASTRFRTGSGSGPGAGCAS